MMIYLREGWITGMFDPISVVCKLITSPSMII